MQVNYQNIIVVIGDLNKVIGDLDEVNKMIGFYNILNNYIDEGIQTFLQNIETIDSIDNLNIFIQSCNSHNDITKYMIKQTNKYINKVKDKTKDKIQAAEPIIPKNEAGEPIILPVSEPIISPELTNAIEQLNEQLETLEKIMHRMQQVKLGALSKMKKIILTKLPQTKKNDELYPNTDLYPVELALYVQSQEWKDKVQATDWFDRYNKIDSLLVLGDLVLFIAIELEIVKQKNFLYLELEQHKDTLNEVARAFLGNPSNFNTQYRQKITKLDYIRYTEELKYIESSKDLSKYKHQESKGVELWIRNNLSMYNLLTESVFAISYIFFFVIYCVKVIKYIKRMVEFRKSIPNDDMDKKKKVEKASYEIFLKTFEFDVDNKPVTSVFTIIGLVCNIFISIVNVYLSFKIFYSRFNRFVFCFCSFLYIFLLVTMFIIPKIKKLKIKAQ